MPGLDAGACSGAVACGVLVADLVGVRRHPGSAGHRGGSHPQGHGLHRAQAGARTERPESVCHPLTRVAGVVCVSKQAGRLLVPADTRGRKCVRLETDRPEQDQAIGKGPGCRMTCRSCGNPTQALGKPGTRQAAVCCSSQENWCVQIGGVRAPTPVGDLGNIEMTQAAPVAGTRWEQVGPDMLLTGYLPASGGVRALAEPTLPVAMEPDAGGPSNAAPQPRGQLAEGAAGPASTSGDAAANGYAGGGGAAMPFGLAPSRRPAIGKVQCPPAPFRHCHGGSAPAARQGTSHAAGAALRWKGRRVLITSCETGARFCLATGHERLPRDCTA
jgi:hypothetical protein